MPGRRSDSGRKSDTSVARFVPFEQETATPQPAPKPAVEPTQTSIPSPAPVPAAPMPAKAETPRPVSASNSTSVPQAGAALLQGTPSDKGKDKEGGGGHPKEGPSISIEELQLPKSIITRLAKGVLPPNTQIQANAILAMSKSATVFINHLANAANELTQQQSKKTIMPQDVFRALDDIEYGFMRDRVEAEFAKFNETQTTKRSTYRKKVAAAKKATKGEGTGGDTSMAGTDADTTMLGDTTMGSVADSSTGGGERQQPQSKKARTGGSGGDNGNSRMDVDEEGQDASDPETIPDENEDDDDEEAEEDEEEDDDQPGRAHEEERDELEERENMPDVDEALDNAEDSE